MSSDSNEILLVSQAFPPSLGGAQSVAFQNACMLAQEYSVTVLTATSSREKEENQYPFQILRLGSPLGLWPLAYRKAFQSLFRDQVQAVILNDAGAIYAAGLWGRDALLRSSIAFLHGSEPELFFESPKLVYRLIGFRRYFVRALEQCHAIVPVSNFMKEKFMRRTRLHDLQQKMSVIHAGVDRDVFFPEPVDIRERHDIPSERIVLLSASRIVAGKGYLEMVRIFDQLLSEGERLHWIIAGTGEYEDELRSEIQRRKISNYTTFVGRLSQDELRQYYSSVDLFWLLSTFDESFGLVYIEANACGLPVVGRRKGGVTEAIEDGSSGFLVEDAEQCARIIRRKSYQNLSRQSVLCHAQRFDVQVMSERLIALVERMNVERQGTSFAPNRV